MGDTSTNPTKVIAEWKCNNPLSTNPSLHSLTTPLPSIATFSFFFLKRRAVISSSTNTSSQRMSAQTCGRASSAWRRQVRARMEERTRPMKRLRPARDRRVAPSCSHQLSTAPRAKPTARSCSADAAMARSVFSTCKQERLISKSR